MKAINKIKQRGSAIIYVIILIVTIMFSAVWISDMVLVDFKVGSSVINYQQASYNTEIGVEYGIKKLQIKNYDELYNGYNMSKYFILDGSENHVYSRNLSETIITKPLPGVFKIEAIGSYNGVERTADLTIKKETLLNLNRKINAEKITLSSGKVSFRIPSLESSLLNTDKILVLRNDGLDKNSNIYSFKAGQKVESEVKTTGQSLFYMNDLIGNRIENISDVTSLKNQWNSDLPGVEYFITESGDNLTINMEKINSINDNFNSGFRNFSGSVDGLGNMICASVRIIFTDGNIVLSGIKGDFITGILTNSERYLNNLVIYSTGKITINDCEFIGYNGSNSADKDINISLIAKEIEFVHYTNQGTGSIINYIGSNQGLIRSLKPAILDIIKRKTSIYSNWAL